MSEDRNTPEEFQKMMDNLKGSIVDYDPSKGFSLSEIDKLMQSFSKPKAPKELTVFTSSIGADLMSGDPVRVADARRRQRINKIAEFRRFIELYGAPIAKTLATLDKKIGRPQNSSWRKYLYDVTYKTINGSEDGSFVKLVVDFNPEQKTFCIRMQAGHDYFVTEVVHDDVLSQNISHKSIFNQLNYFINKFKA